MKVYVVISGYDYSDIGIGGVFTSKEKAEEFVKSLKLDVKYSNIEEHDLNIE